MLPKLAKTSEPEDEREKCGLYAEILHKVHINPRHKRNQVLAIALHNMGAHPGCLRKRHL